MKGQGKSSKPGQMSRTFSPRGGNRRHGFRQEGEGKGLVCEGTTWGPVWQRPADPRQAGLTPAGTSKTPAEAVRPGQ